MTITNTCFRNHIRRLYTWISPGGRWRNQIDYITINQRWRSSIMNVRTLPGADCGSDHQLLIAEMRTKIKAIHRNQNSPKTLGQEELNSYKHKILEKDESLKYNDSTDVDTAWSYLKNAIKNSAEECRSDAVKPRNKWITNETWALISERREIKESGLSNEYSKTKYSEIHKQINKACRHDKNMYIQRICEQVESHSFRNEPKDLFQKVHLLSKKHKPQTWIIENVRGRVLTDIDDVLMRWSEYCNELYKDENRVEELNLTRIDKEPNILLSEIRDAIEKLKCNKSPGYDDISSELIKLLGDNGVKSFSKFVTKYGKPVYGQTTGYTRFLFLYIKKVQQGNAKTIGLSL